jgi:hypothetical protein
MFDYVPESNDIEPIDTESFFRIQLKDVSLQSRNL